MINAFFEIIFAPVSIQLASNPSLVPTRLRHNKRRHVPPSHSELWGYNPVKDDRSDLTRGCIPTRAVPDHLDPSHKMLLDGPDHVQAQMAVSFLSPLSVSLLCPATSPHGQSRLIQSYPEWFGAKELLVNFLPPCSCIIRRNPPMSLRHCLGPMDNPLPMIQNYLLTPVCG